MIKIILQMACSLLFIFALTQAYQSNLSRFIYRLLIHIKAKMKADRDKAKLEAYHKQCPCWNSHNDSCYDDNCPCDRDCEYMKSFNLKIKDLNESERKRNQTETS